MTEHMFGKLKHLIDVARQKAREHHTSRVNNNKTNYGKTKALGRRYMPPINVSSFTSKKCPELNNEFQSQ